MRYRTFGAALALAMVACAPARPESRSAATVAGEACGSLVGDWVAEDRGSTYVHSVRFTFGADGSFASERVSRDTQGQCTAEARTAGVTWRASTISDQGVVTLVGEPLGRESHALSGPCASASAPVPDQKVSDATMQFVVSGDTLRLTRDTGPVPFTFRRATPRVVCR